MEKRLMPCNHRAFAPQPNWGFNADANIGHGFAIFMAYVGTLRTSCSGEAPRVSRRPVGLSQTVAA